MNKAEFERIVRRLELRHEAEAAHAAELAEQAREDLPEDPADFLDRWVWYEHVESHEPVRGLRPHQIDYLQNRAAFRYDGGGHRLAGKDIIGKFRRGAFTSMGLGLGLFSAMRDPGLAGRVFMQLGKGEILEPLHKIIRFVVEEWGRRDRSTWARAWRRVGNFWRHENGSELALLTAGAGLATAAKQARGGGIDWALLSEIGYYAHCGPLLAAVLKAVPPGTGSVFAESTFGPDREHPFAVEYRLTKEGRGRFDRAHFFEWSRDPLKRVPRGSDLFSRVMAPDFPVPRADLEAEKRYQLDDEQRAFRRSEFLLGTSADRRAARRENPEDDETIFDTFGETWLNADSLEALKRDVRPPFSRHRLGPLFSVSIWQPNPRFVVAGVDNAAREGRDYKAAVGLDPLEREQVFEIHGRATDYEMAQACKEVAGELGCPVVWAPERNRAKDLIVYMRQAGLRFYRSAGGAAGKGIGVLSTGTSRPAILAGLVEAVEGSGLEGSTPGPQWRLYSKYLVAELLSLRIDEDGKVRGHPHDDLAIGALGAALYAAPRIPVHSTSPGPPVPRSDISRGSRRLGGGPA